MFKNAVFRMSVDTKKWAKKAWVRAVKTFAQTFVSMVAVGSVLTAVDWTYTLSACAMAFVVSIMTSVAGLPEVEADE